MALSETKVFVPDAKNAWLPAIVLSQNEKEVKVRIEDPSEVGKEEVHDGLSTERIFLREDIIAAVGRDGDADLPLRDDTALTGIGVPNMTALNYLHEAAILYNLRTRFLSANPYTYTGDICIAINPYQWLNLYTDEIRKEHLVFGRDELTPHVFATSSAAFNGIQDSSMNQSVLVSGESGAGKTETVKILMGHLAYMAAGDDQSVIRRIIESNPLLESFGNAKTVRNDNSSRFGKFIELQFNNESRMIGSTSRTYLLEKSRVVHQSIGERNYHIFYQLLANGDSLGDELHQHAVINQDVLDFNYTKGGGVESFAGTIEGKNEEERLAITVSALDLVGLSARDRADLFEIIAAILLLGQVMFVHKDTSEGAGSDVDDTELLCPVCALLKVSVDCLRLAFTERTMVARDDVYKVPLKVEEARDTRDALCKELYARLFLYVVTMINKSTASTSGVNRTIGLLDIFGFESFKVNRFEQLCINFANEKLQQKFTHDVFKTVQEEYEEEGITWDFITFKDNAATLALIESRMGIISVLNEECMRPMGNDEAFASKLSTLHANHPDYAKVKTDRKAFTIRHYAGSVTYSVVGFLEKNKDTLQDDLAELMRASDNQLLQSLFVIAAPSSSDDSAKKKGRRRGSIVAETVSTKFKSQLSQLMVIIAATNVQYVRCIKPNALKSKCTFSMNMVCEQLRCAGVIEAIRISRSGFPNRMTHTEFCSRFGALTPKESLSSAMVHDLHRKEQLRIISVICSTNFATNRFAIGKSKVYFKNGMLEELESQRAVVLEELATMIQRHLRGVLQRRAYQIQRQSALRLQAFLRMFSCRISFQRTVSRVILVQCIARQRTSCSLVSGLRCFQRARTIQKVWRGRKCLWNFKEKAYCAVELQNWARMIIALRNFKIALAEAKEQAKMENQLALLKRRLDEEAEARKQMEEDNRALQERLTNAAQEGVASTSTTRVDQSILDESNKMLQYLQKENGKLNEENASLRREMTKMERENKHLHHSADTAEATMKVLSQHAKALAKAHMKLTSSKEDVDVELERAAQKEERLKEELHMKQAMYIAEVNARLQDREVMQSMVSMVDADQHSSPELVFRLQNVLSGSAETGMLEGDRDSGQQPGRLRGMFGKLFSESTLL